jgi:hypothetical protein
MRCLVASLLALAALRTDVAEQLKSLKAAYKAKDSPAAVRIFDELVQSFEGMAPKDQEEVVKVVESAYATRRDEGEDVNQLFVAAAATLSNMGASGEKAVVRTLALKHVRNKPMVVATLVEGLGRQVDATMVDQILPWLKVDNALGANAPVVVGAVNALARFRAGDPKMRKRVVGEMVGVYVDLDAKYEAERAKPEPSDVLLTAFQQIEKPMRDSLRALSGQQFQKVEDWKKWWSTAKDADWTASGGGGDPEKKAGGS